MRIAILALAAILATSSLSACGPSAPNASVQIGGPFQLVDVEGRPVTEKSLLGKPTAMFFGFTFCPEACPTTLAEMTASLKALGPKADELNVVFVSVDPERDTPAQMKAYLSNFDPRIQGFTGTVAMSTPSPRPIGFITRRCRWTAAAIRWTTPRRSICSTRTEGSSNPSAMARRTSASSTN